MSKTFLDRIQPTHSLSKIAVAMVCAGVAIVGQLILGDLIRESRFILFVPAVVIAAIVAGFRAGLLTLLFCVAGSISFHFKLLADAIQIGIFAAEGVLLSHLSASAFQTTKQKYQALFDQSLQAMYIFDRETLKFLAVNEAALRRYQCTREEFLRMNLEEIRRKDGSLFSVQTHEHDLDFEGRPARLVLATDITELQIVAEHMKRSQALLKSIIDSTTDAVFAKDKEGRYVVCNSTAAMVIGKSVDMVLGHDDTCCFPPAEAKFVMEGDRLAMAQRRITTYEENLTLSNGDTATFLVTKGPMYDANSEVVGVFGIAKNISERKAMEKQLQEAIRARDEFLSIASHELKTPITSLKLQTEVSRRMLKKNETLSLTANEVQKYLERSEKQIDRLGQLVEEILDVSRISVGRLPLRLAEVSLSEVCNEVLDRLTPQIAVAGTRVDFKGTGDVKGVWDRYRIERLLTNLLTNAIKYGDRQPIALTLESRDGIAVLTIADRGIGIQKADQARIFERFERAVSPAAISGLGLGLYIVKQIVDDHGGTISVESEYGKGSTFRVILPLQPHVGKKIQSSSTSSQSDL